MRHGEARAALTEEKDKVELAETEIRVLRRQLDREKSTFEEALSSQSSSYKLYLLYLPT